jgi:hypothetical protein
MIYIYENIYTLQLYMAVAVVKGVYLTKGGKKRKKNQIASIMIIK